MAERLATKTVLPEAAAPTQSPEDEIFKDIVANYDQDVEVRNAGPADYQPDMAPVPSLTDEQQAVLRDLDFPISEAGSEVPASTSAVPVALAPAPAKPRPLTPTIPLPPAPIAPAPLAPIPSPAPEDTTTSRFSESENEEPHPEPVRTETIDTPPPPTPPENEEIPPTDTAERPEPLSLVMIDQSKDAREFARDAADARLTKELNEGRGFRNFLKNKIWKGNLARNYYINRYTREAQAQIEASQDVLQAKVSDAGLRARAQQATMERFQSEYEEMIDWGRQPGDLESRRVLEADSELSRSLKKAIGDFAAGRISSDDLREEGNRLLEDHRQQHGDDLVGEGLVRVDNLIDIAEAVKGSVDHQSALENLRIIMGEARTGARTETRRTLTDKAVELFGKRKMTAWVPEGAIGVASSFASFVVRAGSSKTIGVLTAPFTLGLSLIAPAVVAGVREASHVKAERRQHIREMAAGEEVEGTAATSTGRVKRLLAKLARNRREAMERSRYETVSAQELTNDLRQRQDAILLDDSERLAGETKDGAIRAALDALAAIEARTMMSNTQKKDFISYSDITTIGDERMQLAAARAELKALLVNELDDPTKARLGLANQPDLESIIDSQAGATIEHIEGDISSKDAAARRMKGRRIAAMAGIAVLTGAAIGVAAQEGVAAARSSTTGVFESIAHTEPTEGSIHQTFLKGIFSGDQAGGHMPPDTSAYPETRIGEHGMIALSQDHTLVANNDSTYNMIDKNGNVTVDHLQVGSDGELSPEAQDLLRDKGMSIDLIDNPTYETRPVGFQEFMAAHQSDTTHVKRDLWYDNNTPRKFDKNELGLHRGGVDRTGVTADGNYQIKAAMTELGSHHGKQSADYLELARQGNLKVAISPTAGTQSHPFLVDMKVETAPQIQKDGSTKMVEVVVADIPKDSPAGQFLSVDANGSLQNEGRYIEIVQTGNVDNNGVQHVRPLATWVGHDRAASLPLQDQVKISHPQYRITTGGYEALPTFTEGPPSIPVYGRRSLETLRRRSPTPDTPYYSYGSYRLEYMSAAELQRLRDETSPRLWNNPDAELNPYEELTWYRGALVRKRGQVYADEIDRLILDSPELREVPSNLKNIVTIPINAAGDMESEGIYDRLTKLYGRQDPDVLDRSIILLHVNWFKDLMDNPESRAKIEKTKAEIARARADMPGLRIATIETEWDRSEYSNGVIGHVGRRLADAALLTIERAMSLGQIAEDQEVLVIRQDADPIGMAKDHLKRMDNAADQYPETDVFTGTTSFDNTKASRLPGLVVSGNFMQSMELINAMRGGKIHTAGANFAVRAKTLAAVGVSGLEDGNAGAGSDDVEIGRRIEFARSRNRGIGYIAGSTYAPGIVNNSQYSASGTSGTSSRRVARRVAGARIDTDSDRQENMYRQGKPIIFSWNNGRFDANGYVDRNAGLTNASFSKENLRRDRDKIIERIRNDIEATINVFGSESLARTGLAFMFSGVEGDASIRAYDLVQLRDGSFSLNFTEEGERELIRHLTRDSRGRSDPYGRRKLRQMYGRAKWGQRQPLRQQMLAA